MWVAFAARTHTLRDEHICKLKFFFLSLCDTGLEALREQIEFEFTFVKLSTWIFRPRAVYVTVIAYIQIKRLQLADQTRAVLFNNGDAFPQGTIQDENSSEIPMNAAINLFSLLFSSLLSIFFPFFASRRWVLAEFEGFGLHSGYVLLAGAETKTETRLGQRGCQRHRLSVDGVSCIWQVGAALCFISSALALP